MKKFNESILTKRYKNITKLTGNPNYENCYLIDGKIVIGVDVRLDGTEMICFQSYNNGSFKEYPKPKTFIEFENQAKEYLPEFGTVLEVI